METKAKGTLFLPERADPYVMKGPDGFYYFTASYPMRGGTDKTGYDRVILRKSTSLRGLAETPEITIWESCAESLSHRFIWAPELHFVHGKWVIYYSGSTQADNRWAIDCHALVCEGEDPMQGPWVEKGKLQGLPEDDFSFTGFSLDMARFCHKGKDYVIWAQHSREKISCLYMAGLDQEEPWKLTTLPMLLTKPEYDWECVRFAVNEGPAVLVRDGKVIVAYSASGTGPEYCMGAMVADADAELLEIGSWTKWEQPILTSEDLTEEYGPGHNSFAEDENGQLMVIYHARSKECFDGRCGFAQEDPLYDPCRHARLLPYDKLVWNRRK